MKSLVSISIGLSFFLLFSTCFSLPLSSQDECKAWLVQSIPTDMPDLTLVPGVLNTADVFKWLAGNSTSKLDVMAQYWQLVAGPNNTFSGDYGYSQEEMDIFGAQEGFEVYKAIENAANRSVVIRLLQHSGVYPDYAKEAADLATAGPNVTNVTLLLSEWFGSGIIHAKVWIADDRDVYIGSANNDWKSLTQVKEVGIYLAGCNRIAKKVRQYYDNLWTLASLNATLYTRSIYDSQWQLDRTDPCWSHFIPKDDRCKNRTIAIANTDISQDYRAGFWGVIGGPCLCIVHPFIEEFHYPMPKKCAAGNTGVYVNGRELQQKNLDLLSSRGLSPSKDRSYIVEITRRVVDENFGKELDSLGKLAPT